MTRTTLGRLRNASTLSGVVVTLTGICYNLAHGGDILGAYISLGGVVITCVGHLVGAAIARHDKQEKEEYEERIRAAEDFMAEFGDIADKVPSLRRIIYEQDSRYEIEHQDDRR
jgi:hypothetical protein